MSYTYLDSESMLFTYASYTPACALLEMKKKARVLLRARPVTKGVVKSCVVLRAEFVTVCSLVDQAGSCVAAPHLMVLAMVAAVVVFCRGRSSSRAA